jgi:Yip1-like protein
MAETGETGPGVIGGLLERERRLVPRLEGVLWFRSEVYREIESDPHAIPQSIAVVVATSVLVGLGQGGLVSVFIGLAGSILLWIAATSLLWLVARFTVDAPVDFSKLLRCTGFAYAWFALELLAGLPILGEIFAWAAVALVLASFVVATREVLEIDTSRAALVCAVALGVPLLVLVWLGG